MCLQSCILFRTGTIVSKIYLLTQFIILLNILMNHITVSYFLRIICPQLLKEVVNSLTKFFGTLRKVFVEFICSIIKAIVCFWTWVELKYKEQAPGLSGWQLFHFAFNPVLRTTLWYNGFLVKFPKRGRQKAKIRLASIKRGIYSSSKRVRVTEERRYSIGINLTLLFYKEYSKT